MGEYTNDDQLVSVAHSCRRFSPRRAGGMKHDPWEEDMSCGACKSWDGSRCIKNTYDSVLSILDQ